MRQNQLPLSSNHSALLCALAALSFAATASAQQYPIYSENFQTGYVTTGGSNTLSDQAGWTTNDESTNATYGGNTGDIGQSDFVGFVGGGFNVTGDNAGALGGIYGSAVAPGRTDVTLNHSVPTGGAATVGFSLDFSLSGSAAVLQGNNVVAGPHDGFRFSLTGVGGQSMININFTKPTTEGQANGPAANTRDNIGYSSNLNVPGASTNTSSFPLNGRYKLVVNVNVTAQTFNASFAPENAAGVVQGALLPITTDANGLLTNVAYGNLGGIQGYLAGWTLADTTTATVADLPVPLGSTNNTAFTNFGTNRLAFDNVLVTIPEPSTYALLALGVFGLGFAVRRTRRTQVA